MPASFTLLIGAILAALFIARLLHKGSSNAPTRGKRPAAAYSYTLSEALFTPAERDFLLALDHAVGAHYRVFGKVRVADVLAVDSAADRSAWQRGFNQISAKHFDFVLCRADTLAIVAAIELNDASHRQKRRTVRDKFLMAACDAAGLPLIQVRASREYCVSTLRDQISTALGIAPQAALN